MKKLALQSMGLALIVNLIVMAFNYVYFQKNHLLKWAWRVQDGAETTEYSLGWLAAHPGGLTAEGAAHELSFSLLTLLIGVLLVGNVILILSVIVKHIRGN